jgi:hypothetical protein
MSDYNWCHGPECHTKETQSRVRGSAGNKVLRTRRIKYSHWNSQDRYSMFNYFCGNNCLFDYLTKHLQSIVAIAPRREALETKIKDPVKETTTNNYGYTWTNTKIEKRGVDNNNG